jgi:hypothetical protein
VWFVRKPKIAKTDFNPANLPKTRKEVFKDVMKHHWVNLLVLGVFLLLFGAPLIVTRCYLDLVSVNIAQAYVNGTMTSEDATTSLLGVSNMFGLINIVLYLILALGMAGTMRIIKRYGFLDNVSFKEDFALGVRQNYWQYALLFFIFGLLAFLCDYVDNLSASLGASGEVYSWLGSIPRVVALILMYPIFCYTLVSISIYQNKFFQQLKVGLICLLRKVWLSIPMLLLCSLPLAVCLVPNFYCHLFGGIASFILMPIALEAWFCFTMDTLDKKFNPGRYPELVNKGLIGLQASAEETVKKAEENKEYELAKEGAEAFNKKEEPPIEKPPEPENKGPSPTPPKESETAAKPPAPKPPKPASGKKKSTVVEVDHAYCQDLNKEKEK